MKKTLITTIIATIALSSATTFASAHDNGKRGGGRHHGPKIETMLEKLDTNKDGGISLDEIKASQADLFGKVDANSDNALSEEEFAMIKDIRKAERQAKRDANKAERMKTAKNHDRDGKRGDGKGKRGGKRGFGPSFERLDADKSGTISLNEFTSHTDKMFKRMDRNSDGVINKDDVKRKKG